ncbi:MAG: Bifunctional protein Aas [Verrucomicrobia subdivision 3 bacterium]|nr:Bifunctional protein Aas [Limisphaerales bacterium]MCS1416539.1 Bifunctional protein Aas [Limisphaerales bacterium]
MDQLNENANGHEASPQLWRKGFWSLFVTQFQGAFSDNAFRFLVMFLVMEGMTRDEKDALAPVINAVFALPFILFSMIGGMLADRYSKRTIAIGTKVAEVAIMSLAFIGLVTNQIVLLGVVVFLMSTQSAFFGPAKYGLLPEMLPESRLSWGNGIFSLGTFVAIIVGIIVAGQLSDRFGAASWVCGVFLVGLAILGLSTSLGVMKVPAADPRRRIRLNYLPDLWRQVKSIRRDRMLFLAIIGDAYFLFLGAMMQLTVLFYSKESLGLSDSDFSYLMGALAIGIGAGSFVAGYLSEGKIEYGLVPLGALGMTGSCFALAIPDADFQRVFLCLVSLGFFGGFFVVPLVAMIQHRANPAEKGAVLAIDSIAAFCGVVVASGVYYGYKQGIGFSDLQIFFVCGLTTLAGSSYAVYLLPDSLLRFLLLWFTHTVYRIKIVGRENIPERGGALLVANHLSFVDVLLLQASMDRPIRFIMYRHLYEKWWLKPIVRLFKVIPITSQSRPKEMIKSLKKASEAIRKGEVVCIFAEGQITRTGQLLPFRRGFECIMKDVDAPIVPVNLDGLWGSIFSFERERFMWKIPRSFPYPATISYGRPMPSDSAPGAVRRVVQELNAEAWAWRKRRMLSIPAGFVRSARWHPFRSFMSDSCTENLRFGGALLKSLFLARRLKLLWGRQDMVGILLPPSIGGALVNYAAWLLGKVPVNLNYTLPAEGVESCIRQCGIQQVITSKEFAAHLKLELQTSMVYLEAEAANPRTAEKVMAFLTACFCPYRMMRIVLGAEKRAALDDVATVVFSSGSTGAPKGVELTHYNIASNVDQLTQVFSLASGDCFLGVLPFFHSFGFTGTMVLPALSGVRVVYYPNPLDARKIGELVNQHRVSFLLATPTFLQIYLRGCAPEQFGSVQSAMVGAEKLPERVARAFEERFGLRPLEAFGCTECSPGVSVNTRDHRNAGIYQVGAKRGTIGHPLPGISVRIVDHETGEALPSGQPGLLLVKGPNVMKGYLGKPEKTAEVLKDGWYVTGDIATMDEDGFLRITDRLSRFSKIGGEMVPHIKVEEVLQQAAEETETVFAVTGLPDEQKGERLVVLHTLAEKRLAGCLEKFAGADLPNLWKPRADQFYSVGALPYLGSGKLDLRRVREIAAELSG